MNSSTAVKSANIDVFGQVSDETNVGYWLDPLIDSRWPRLLAWHPRATVFHTPEWLQALRRTYGYRPLVLTTTPPECELSNGWVFCDVKSLLTGRRLVSLPFSDYCDPLVSDEDELPALIECLTQQFRCGNWKSIQARPQSVCLAPEGRPSHFAKAESFCLHKVDLQPSLSQIYSRFHKHSIVRKIRRAERERLTYEEGRSEAFIQQFYRLLLLTRRRHQLPPQPLGWFRNVVNCMGEQAKIRVCLQNGQAIAAMMTLTYKQSMVYKYGCSDARFHNVGGMPFLFWNAIQDAKQYGARELDLGRSSHDNEGLTTFKDHLGGTRSLLTYWSYPGAICPEHAAGWKLHVARHLFRWMPDRLLAIAGKLLYRHMG